MKITSYRVIACMAAALTLGGCSQTAASGKRLPSSAETSAYTADNEILTYRPVDTQKTVVTVGKYMAFDEKPLEEALEETFPDIDFVWLESFVGTDPFAYMTLQSRDGSVPDMIFVNRMAPENSYLYDLAAEGLVSRYSLSALNSTNKGGRLYQLPIANTMAGIVYNKTLFEEHGWKAPESLDEFYALCEAISAEGIRPFVSCLKYYTTLQIMGLGLTYDDTLGSLERQNQYNDFVQGSASCEGLLEPMFELLQTLYKKGIVTADDFSSSATEVRHSLYAGDFAMMTTNLDILALYNEERPDCELDFIGFPTKSPGERRMRMVPGTRLSVSKRAMEDAKKKQLILNVLDYLSTGEGQSAMLRSFSGLSSLDGYQQEMYFEYDDIQSCIENGRIFFADYYGSNDDIPVFKEWTMGRMTMEEMITANDHFKPLDELKQLEKPPIGTAEEKFTILETSLLNADVMREAAGADIALLLNNYYYKGNMAQIFKGEIVYPARFILKNVSDKDYLTVYEITGKSLKELMEHPLINGREVNAMYAPSGMKIEYAPHAPADANVVDLKLEDGTALDDGKIYTVAAWAGSIDEGYIAGTVKEYSELGTNEEIMVNAIQSAGTIKPDFEGRVVLDWD